MHGPEATAAHLIFGWDPLWVSSILFVVTYAVIVSEKVNRAIVSLLGAGLILALGGTVHVLQLTLALGGAWAFGWHLTWQLRRLDIDDPDRCMMLFRSNRNAGLIPAAPARGNVRE